MLLTLTHHLVLFACSLDYSDLADQVERARQHDAEARRIAAAGSELARTRLREDDAACYWYRLLLEYGALYRDNSHVNIA